MIKLVNIKKFQNKSYISKVIWSVLVYVMIVVINVTRVCMLKNLKNNIYVTIFCGKQMLWFFPIRIVCGNVQVGRWLIIW